MGTEVMIPHDCLIQRVTPFHHRKIGHGNGNVAFCPRYRKPAGRSEKKRCSAETKRSPSVGNLNPGELVMGRVTILRRGESMGSLYQKIRESVPAETIERVGGDDLRRIRIGDVYAGSAFSNSPSPRSLPVPSFFSNPNREQDGLDDSATRYLRRVLRLEF